MEEKDSRDMRQVFELMKERIKLLEEQRDLLKNRQRELQELNDAFEQINRNLA